MTSSRPAIVPHHADSPRSASEAEPGRAEIRTAGLAVALTSR